MGNHLTTGRERHDCQDQFGRETERNSSRLVLARLETQIPVVADLFLIGIVSETY
jgi:hypothetical protein